jgi:hypothetical protein
MSQVLELCKDISSDDNGECPNTTSVPPLPVSRKRPRDSEELPNDHPRNDNDPGDKTATGSAEFEGDLDNESDDSSEEALPYQARDWAKKFQELCRYRESKGHCNFQCQDPDYAELSRWVFSQRCEYRRMVGGMVGGKNIF